MLAIDNIKHALKNEIIFTFDIVMMCDGSVVVYILYHLWSLPFRHLFPAENLKRGLDNDTCSPTLNSLFCIFYRAIS
jgi:hypothetical protein